MMRHLVLVALVLALTLPMAVPAEAAGPGVAGKTVIKADKSRYDFEKGLYELTGNVYIEWCGQKITAGGLFFSPPRPPLGGRVCGFDGEYG